MIIAISGSVGVGKTSLADALSKELGYEVWHLGDYVSGYELEQNHLLETIDFDLDAFLEDFEKKLKGKENLIIESHFAHFFTPELVDLLVIINRDLQALEAVYKERGYTEEKRQENLEVESFNLCFHEADEEGYDQEQILCLSNEKDLAFLVDKVVRRVLQ